MISREDAVQQAKETVHTAPHSFALCVSVQLYCAFIINRAPL